MTLTYLSPLLAGLMVWLVATTFQWWNHRDIKPVSEARLEITICFDRGEPMMCDYRGDAEFLMEMLNHVPREGTRFGDQEISSVNVQVVDA